MHTLLSLSRITTVMAATQLIHEALRPQVGVAASKPQERGDRRRVSKRKTNQEHRKALKQMGSILPANVPDD